MLIARLRWTALLGTTVVLWAACGDSTGPAAERNNPGTGTKTMLVTADIEAKDEPAGFITDFDVSLRDAVGNPITGATVTISNGELGSVTLDETPIDSGDYFAQRFGFGSGDYRLDAVRGTDMIEGVVVGGMSGHSIMAPAKNDTVPAGQPLGVTWTVPSEAAGADVESQNYTAEGIIDSGSHTIPGASIQLATDERVRVWRFNQVEIVGGLFGSRLKLKVRNTVEPIVVQ